MEQSTTKRFKASPADRIMAKRAALFPENIPEEVAVEIGIKWHRFTNRYQVFKAKLIVRHYEATGELLK